MRSPAATVAHERRHRLAGLRVGQCLQLVEDDRDRRADVAGRARDEVDELVAVDLVARHPDHARSELLGPRGQQ